MENCVAYALNNVLFAGLALAAGAAAVAQDTAPTNNMQEPASGWTAPGTPGSPIDGEIFHAQVLLDAAGFPAGVIDGKKGMSFRKAVEGFQEARGLDQTGELDAVTRRALLEIGRSPGQFALGPESPGPFAAFQGPESRRTSLPRYRHQLEKLAKFPHYPYTTSH